MADLVWKTSLNDDIILKWDLFDWYDPTYKIGLSRQILDEKYTCIYAQDTYFVGESTVYTFIFKRDIKKAIHYVKYTGHTNVFPKYSHIFNCSRSEALKFGLRLPSNDYEKLIYNTLNFNEGE